MPLTDTCKNFVPARTEGNQSKLGIRCAGLFGADDNPVSPTSVCCFWAFPRWAAERFKTLAEAYWLHSRLNSAVPWLYQDPAGSAQITGQGHRAEPLAHGEHSVCDSDGAEAFNQEQAALTGTHLHLTLISQGKCFHPLKKEELGSCRGEFNFSEEQWKSQLNCLQTATKKKEASSKQCGLPRTKPDAVYGARKTLRQRSSCGNALHLQPCSLFQNTCEAWSV